LHVSDICNGHSRSASKGAEYDQTRNMFASQEAFEFSGRREAGIKVEHFDKASFE